MYNTLINQQLYRVPFPLYLYKFRLKLFLNRILEIVLEFINLLDYTIINYFKTNGYVKIQLFDPRRL